MQLTASRKSSPIKPDASRSAAAFGCTIEQAKSLLAKNASSLLWMADKAATKGGRYNGYTESELRISAAQYAEAAA